MDANSALFIAGGLAVLLLFGCVGPKDSAGPQQPAPPPKQPEKPGGDLGDSEISSPEANDIDDLLPEDSLIPPPEEPVNETNQSMGTTEGNESESSDSELKIDISDLFVGEGSDMDYISEEDIIEPI